MCSQKEEDAIEEEKEKHLCRRKRVRIIEDSKAINRGGDIRGH